MKPILPVQPILLAALLPLAPALAQEAAPAEAASDEIVVIGRGPTYQLPGKRIRAAQRAFADDRARFAPLAIMRFTTIRKSARPLDGLTFTLVRGDRRVAVPMDADGGFVVPPLDADDWTLEANRAPREIGLRVWVLSPGATEADRPLGDLRLQCRVNWQLRRGQFSLVQKAAFSTLGGCDSSRIAFASYATRPVASAAIGARTLALMNGGASYHVPLGDKALPNDARVRLVYR